MAAETFPKMMREPAFFRPISVLHNGAFATPICRDIYRAQSIELRTSIKDIVTLLGTSRQSHLHALGVHGTRGMDAVSLACKYRMQDHFPARF